MPMSIVSSSMPARQTMPRRRFLDVDALDPSKAELGDLGVLDRGVELDDRDRVADLDAALKMG